MCNKVSWELTIRINGIVNSNDYIIDFLNLLRNKLPKFENLLILGNEKNGLSQFILLLILLSKNFKDCKYKKLAFANLLY